MFYLSSINLYERDFNVLEKYQIKKIADIVVKSMFYINESRSKYIIYGNHNELWQTSATIPNTIDKDNTILSTRFKDIPVITRSYLNNIGKIRKCLTYFALFPTYLSDSDDKSYRMANIISLELNDQLKE